SATPLHERMYESVRRLILDGTLGFASRLPSSRTLAKQMSVSRGSVSTAMDRLSADGWLVTRRGSGSYVSYRGAYAAKRFGDDHASIRNLQPVPFALGIPPLDLFPKAIWTRLQSRRWRAISSAHLQEGAPTGWRGLQDAIAGYLAAWRGLAVAPAQIVVS